MSNLIKGVMPVIIMPYTKTGHINWEELHFQIDHIVSTGCDGVVVGQVSEVLRLTDKERFQLSKEIVVAANGRISTVMSTGSESVHQAIIFSKQAEESGCDALLVMHPTIMALNDEQMLIYYRSVIESVNCTVIIHHAKSLSKKPLSILVQAKLLQEYGAEKVQFKPEAAPTPPRVSELLLATNQKARIFEGDGGMMLADTFQRGVVGIIPATETAEITVALWNLLEQGRFEEARTISYPLSYLMCHMMNSIDCYLGISKFLLERRKISSNGYIRPPVDYVVDPDTLNEVVKIYDDLLELALSFHIKESR